MIGQLQSSGVRVQTPYHAPNVNAHAKCLMRSVKEECLARWTPQLLHGIRSSSGNVRDRKRQHRAVRWNIFSANLAAMSMDEVARDRQPESRAPRGRSLVKPIEDLRQILRRDARPGIGNTEHHPAILHPRCNNDIASLRCM